MGNVMEDGGWPVLDQLQYLCKRSAKLHFKATLKLKRLKL